MPATRSPLTLRVVLALGGLATLAGCPADPAFEGADLATDTADATVASDATDASELDGDAGDTGDSSADDTPDSVIADANDGTVSDVPDSSAAPDSDADSVPCISDCGPGAVCDHDVCRCLETSCSVPISTGVSVARFAATLYYDEESTADVRALPALVFASDATQKLSVRRWKEAQWQGDDDIADWELDTTIAIAAQNDDNLVVAHEIAGGSIELLWQEADGWHPNVTGIGCDDFRLRTNPDDGELVMACKYEHTGELAFYDISGPDQTDYVPRTNDPLVVGRDNTVFGWVMTTGGASVVAWRRPGEELGEHEIVIARQIGTTWNTEIVDVVSMPTGFALGLDRSDDPHLAYGFSDGSEAVVRHTYLSDAITWSHAEVRRKAVTNIAHRIAVASAVSKSEVHVAYTEDPLLVWRTIDGTTLGEPKTVAAVAASQLWMTSVEYARPRVILLSEEAGTLSYWLPSGP